MGLVFSVTVVVPEGGRVGCLTVLALVAQWGYLEERFLFGSVHLS